MTDRAVSFDAVSFSYGDAAAKNSICVLENASFHIHRGEFVAMVGPNASGKSTVLKLLFGLETPSSGSIEIFGKVIRSGKNKQKECNLAYVPQQLPADNMFPITVRDIVRMGLLRPLKNYPQDNDAVTEAMVKTGIADITSRPYSSLSGGQKRRSLVARALAAMPDLLVLDEPTANMDGESEARLYETLSLCKGGTTILIVTHDTEFVTSLADRVLCLGEGRKVVQHRIEKDASVSGFAFAHSADSSSGYSGQVRILHGENIPADACCPADASSRE